MNSISVYDEAPNFGSRMGTAMAKGITKEQAVALSDEVLRDARSYAHEVDIQFARDTEVHPKDVQWLRTQAGRMSLQIILRCPKKGSLGFIGRLISKSMEMGSTKGGFSVKSFGVGVGYHEDSNRMFVSDYDLMSLWHEPVRNGGFRKLVASEYPGAKRGPLMSADADHAFKELNKELISKFQHGAQDDYLPGSGKTHPNVQADTRFAVFRLNELIYLPDMKSCREHYLKDKLDWPYTPVGRFKSSVARQAMESALGHKVDYPK